MKRKICISTILLISSITMQKAAFGQDLLVYNSLPEELFEECTVTDNYDCGPSYQSIDSSVPGPCASNPFVRCAISSSVCIQGREALMPIVKDVFNQSIAENNLFPKFNDGTDTTILMIAQIAEENPELTIFYRFRANFSELPRVSNYWHSGSCRVFLSVQRIEIPVTSTMGKSGWTARDDEITMGAISNAMNKIESHNRN